MPRHELPRLLYDFGELEPYIDKSTLELHYSKHHNTYVSNLNKALEKINACDSPLEEIIKNISKYPVEVRNNGGGHFNHSLYWSILKPNSGGKPNGSLAEAINSDFGTFEDFKIKFNHAASACFGSGWAWLIVNNSKLNITVTPNQDNPLMDIAAVKGEPILGLDVWEHAYYLQYKHRRSEYIANWWNIINWTEVSRRFALFDTIDPYLAFQRE
jgi:Fe-Mn family superoxide dismutase